MAGRFSVEAVFDAVDKISLPVQRMENSVGRFARKTSKAMRSVARFTDKATSSVFKLAKGFVSLGAKAAKFTLGGGLLGFGATTLINKTSVEFENLADSVGLSVETAEALSNAVKSIGLNGENVIDLMEEMNNKLGESAGLKEITPVTESLKILGLSFKEIKGLAPEKQFKKIADAALKLEDSQVAQGAVDILMGGEANKIIGALRKQGSSVDEIIKKMQRYDFITDKSREGAKEFVREWEKLELIIKSLSRTISGMVGGKLGGFIELMNKRLIANKKVIQEWLDTVLGFFDKEGKKALEWLTSLTKQDFRDAWRSVKEVSIEIYNVFKDIAGLVKEISTYTDFWTKKSTTSSLIKDPGGTLSEMFSPSNMWSAVTSMFQNPNRSVMDDYSPQASAGGRGSSENKSNDSTINLMLDKGLLPSPYQKFAGSGIMITESGRFSD